MKEWFFWASLVKVIVSVNYNITRYIDTWYKGQYADIKLLKSNVKHNDNSVESHRLENV